MSSNSGLRTNGCRATEKFSLSNSEFSPLIRDLDTTTRNYFSLRTRARLMSEDEFIEQHASGTLRKNKRLSFHYKKQYLHERTAFDFGWGFECIHESHINWGQPITEGDCSAITEAGWFIDRYQFMAFPGDEFEAKYIQVSSPDETKEGVGIIIRRTSAPYVPDGHVVFAIIAKVNPITHQYEDAVNPC
jgi:hypothetical protein